MFSGKNRLGLLVAAAATVIGATAGVNHSRAGVLFWNPNGTLTGGSGTWDTTSPNWNNGATQQTYANSLSTEAIFAGTTGTVTLNSTPAAPILAGILRQSGSVYVYTGGDLETPDIQVAAFATADIKTNLVGNQDLTIEQTDSSLGSIVAFLNDTVNINSLNVTNDVTLPANQLGLLASFNNATVNFAASTNPQNVALQVQADATASILAATQFNFSNATANISGTLNIDGAGTQWTGGSSLNLLGAGTLNVGSGAQINQLATLGTQSVLGGITINGGAAVNLTGDLYLSKFGGNVSTLTVSDSGTTLNAARLDIGGTLGNGLGGTGVAAVENGAAATISGTTELWSAGDILTVNNATLTTADLAGSLNSILNLGNPSTGSALTVNGNSGETTYFYGTINNFTNSAGTQVPGGITKDGNSNMVLAAANTYSGATIINAGTISLANSDALQNTPVTLNVVNGINFNGLANATIGGLNGAANLNIGATNVTLNNIVPASYSGLFSATSGGITVAGVASQTFTGGTVLNPSRLEYLAVGGSTGVASTATLTGGNLQLSVNTGSALAVNAGTLNIDGGAAISIASTANALVNGTLSISDSGTTWSGAAGLLAVGSGNINVTGNAVVSNLGALEAAGANTAININSGATLTANQINLNNGGLEVSNFTEADAGTKVNANSFFIGGFSTAQNGGIANALIEINAAMNVSGTTELWNAGDSLSIYSASLTTADLAGATGSLLFLTNNVSLGGSALTVNGNSNETTFFSGTIANYSPAAGVTLPGGITKDGNSNMVLAGANTYSGATIINGGTISIVNALALQDTAVTVNANDGINFGAQPVATIAGLNGAGNLNLADTGVTLVENNSESYSGTFSAYTGGITVVGPASQTFTGGTAADPSIPGYLAVGQAGQAAANVILSGGNMLLTATGSTGFSGNSSLFVEDGNQLTIQNGAQLTTYDTPQVNNTGSVTVEGVGSLWTNESDPTGGTSDIRIGYAGGVSTLTIKSGGEVHAMGNMDIGGFAASTNPGLGQVNVNAGGTLLVDDALNIAPLSDLTVNQGQATVGSLVAGDAGGYVAISDLNAATPALIIAPITQMTDSFSDVIENAAGGPGSIVYTPTSGATLLLNGLNTYSGSTTVNGAGILTLQTQTDSSNFYAFNGGNLTFAGTLNANDQVLVPLVINLTATGQMLTDSASAIHFYSATVTGGTFTGIGYIDGQQDLPNTNTPGPIPQNTFNDTVFEPGSQIIASAPSQFNNLTNAGTMTFNYATTFQNVTNVQTGRVDFNNGTNSVSNFINDGQVSVTGTKTIVNAGNYDYSQTGSNITINPGATWNNAPGSTLIVAGTLQNDGVITGNVSAQSGSNVSGSGTMDVLTTAAGATIRPGGDGNTLTITTLTLGDETNLNFLVGSPTSNENRKISTTDLTLGNNVAVTLALSGQLQPGVYTLLTYSNSITNLGDLATWTVNGPAGYNFNISDPVGSITLSVTAVPEPAALAMLVCGGLPLLARRRRS